MKTALITMCAALLSAGAANAQPPEFDLPASERVSVIDLNLASPEGLVLLDRRIRGAADRVCGSPGNITDLESRGRNRRCFNAAVADARTQRDRILAARGLISGIRTAALESSRD